jgi:hypothetical protein
MNPLIRRDACPHCGCTLPPTLERAEHRPTGHADIHQTTATRHVRCKRCMGRYQLNDAGELIRQASS